MMRVNHKAITRAFGGKLLVRASLQRYVIRVVAKLPNKLIGKITRFCWFLGSVDDAWAYTFRGDEIKGTNLIILSDSLLDQSHEDIEWTILHEIGHVILGHHNSILVTQTRQEIRRQEREADAFAMKYLCFD